MAYSLPWGAFTKLGEVKAHAEVTVIQHIPSAMTIKRGRGGMPQKRKHCWLELLGWGTLSSDKTGWGIPNSSYLDTASMKKPRQKGSTVCFISHAKSDIPIHSFPDMASSLPHKQACSLFLDNLKCMYVVYIHMYTLCYLYIYISYGWSASLKSLTLGPNVVPLNFTDV